jgi:hypothetical protein
MTDPPPRPVRRDKELTITAARPARRTRREMGDRAGITGPDPVAGLTR